MIAYGIMTLSVSIISAGIRYITDDIVTSRAANGDFQSYLAEANLSESQQIRLGLMADANGGWTTRSGETFDAPPVVFDVQNPAFDFNMVDYASLADHPYGQEQIGAVKSVLKGAVAAELSGPLAFLVNLAGLFSAVFALPIGFDFVATLVGAPGRRYWARPYPCHRSASLRRLTGHLLVCLALRQSEFDCCAAILPWCL